MQVFEQGCVLQTKILVVEEIYNSRFVQFYMSQSERRFSNRPSSTEPQQQFPPSPPPSLSPASLPTTPANYVPEDLTIHIDSSGHKRLVNSQGEQSIIYPLLDKFFGDYSRSSSDKVGTHNREAAINTLKRDMQHKYQIPPQSRIFNYAVREIHLLSQLYQGLISEREKQEIIEEYTILKDRNMRAKNSFLLYAIFMIGTRRTMWSRLTANRSVQLGLCLFGVTLWTKTYLDLGSFEVMSIMRHNSTYENLLQTYEKDYKIVY